MNSKSSLNKDLAAIRKADEKVKTFKGEFYSVNSIFGND